jgi:hypothetical protein
MGFQLHAKPIPLRVQIPAKTLIDNLNNPITLKKRDPTITKLLKALVGLMLQCFDTLGNDAGLAIRKLQKKTRNVLLTFMPVFKSGKFQIIGIAYTIWREQ